MFSPGDMNANGKAGSRTCGKLEERNNANSYSMLE